jgi:hypothetical protein
VLRSLASMVAVICCSRIWTAIGFRFMRRVERGVVSEVVRMLGEVNEEVVGCSLRSCAGRLSLN